MLFPTISRRSNNLGDLEQIVGPERREREVIADFQLPIVDLIRAAVSTQSLDVFLYTQAELIFRRSLNSHVRGRVELMPPSGDENAADRPRCEIGRAHV